MLGLGSGLFVIRYFDFSPNQKRKAFAVYIYVYIYLDNLDRLVTRSSDSFIVEVEYYTTSVCIYFYLEFKLAEVS